MHMLNDVYSVSQPDEGTDTYVAAFTNDLMPNELLPESNPEAVDSQMLTQSFYTSAVRGNHNCYQYA